MTFRDEELRRLGEYAHRTWGDWTKDWAYPYVLPAALAHENLLPDVRDTAISYFNDYDIAWWLSKEEQTDRKQRPKPKLRPPTGHLNSSQVACVNYLEPARVDHAVALAVARRVDPRVVDVHDTGEGGYVAFEWIGDKAYLGEAGGRTRGAKVTSLDALMRVTLDTGARALLAIEWKYLESYGKKDVSVSRNGTDRVATYRTHLDSEASPILPGDPARLFYDPYEQLMRQTLLVALHVADPQTAETEWTHAHVIPVQNTALRTRVRGTVPLLGDSELLEETWRTALKAPERYRVLDPSGILPSSSELSPRWHRWRSELDERYQHVDPSDAASDAGAL